MIFPQLVQSEPGPKIAGGLGIELVAQQERAHLDVPSAEGEVVGRRSVDGPGCRVDDPHGPQVQGRAQLVRGERGRRDQGSVGAESTDARITYSRPIAPALSNLAQFFILPEHIWSKKAGKNGRGLKEFKPQAELPVVAGGPYTVTQFEQKGTTAFKPNPNFYGPKSKQRAWR